MNLVFSFLRAMAGKVIVPQFERKYARFERQMREAKKLQRELLFGKIRRLADTEFGRDHHFREIRTIADFRRNVPVAQYDDYYPYIKKVTEGDVNALLPAGEKILMFTLSSGTTDDPKLIPVNPTWMSEYRRGWQVWGIKAFRDHHILFYSKLAGMAGNWDMRRTPTGVGCGMASGLSARMQHPLLRIMYCIPPAIFEIDDVDAKYYAALRLAVAAQVGLFMSATPATVVNFARLGDRHRDALIADVAEGTISDKLAIPEPVRRMMQQRVGRPDPRRARELERIVTETGHLYPRDYWNLALVACWLGGTVGTYARHIPDYYGDVACRDIGLLCSEGRFTIPLDDGTPAGALEIASHYYEFIPESEIESEQPTVLECHELIEGENYFILPSTSSGLFRYNIYDVMRCTGHIGETPLLEFLNKGSRFSDMEGEKLTEHHFVRAVSESAAGLALGITGFTAVPIRPADGQGAPYYALLVDEQEMTDHATAIEFLNRVDDWLQEHNVMYQGKRADRYLGPLHLVRLAGGSWARFDRDEIARRGVSEDHYKHPCLVLDADFAGRFEQVEEIVPAERPAAGHTKQTADGR